MQRVYFRVRVAEGARNIEILMAASGCFGSLDNVPPRDRQRIERYMHIYLGKLWIQIMVFALSSFELRLLINRFKTDTNKPFKNFSHVRVAC